MAYGARVVGRTLFLRTPGGMGRSELAVQLARSERARATGASGTAPNWATVTKLLALLDASSAVLVYGADSRSSST